MEQLIRYTRNNLFLVVTNHNRISDEYEVCIHSRKTTERSIVRANSVYHEEEFFFFFFFLRSKTDYEENKIFVPADAAPWQHQPLGARRLQPE